MPGKLRVVGGPLPIQGKLSHPSLGTAPARQTPDMAATMTHEGGTIYRLDVSGTLHKADLEPWQRVLATEAAHLGSVRLLVVLRNFNGWSDSSDWTDMEFYQTHGDRIERIAIVGDDQWREQALMFIGAGLRPAVVDFFVPGALSQARHWLEH
jgi:hypothetical protein